MKTQFKLFGALLLLLPYIGAQAQAPNISYSPSTSILTVGVPFSVAPANTGGAVPPNVYAQVTTLASGFSFPLGIVADASGNFYIADYNNNVIRKVTPAGVVSVFAGSGAAGFANGTGTAAIFKGPEGIAIDAAGNLYIGDFNNNLIRKITPGAVVTTFASGPLISGPAGMCFDAAGNLYVAEQNGATISKITPAAVVSTYAGAGLPVGFGDNANKLLAKFNNPIDVQADAAGNIFVADYQNNRIREVTTAGAVITFAGSGAAGSANGTGTTATFNTPTGIAQDAAGNFYIADYANNLIRKITPAGVVTTIAGSGGGGNVDAIGTAAQFGNPVDMYIDNNDIAYIIDGSGNNVRKMPLTGYGISATLPAGLSFDGTTGIISGTPSGTFGPTNYTITAYNLTGQSSTTVTLSCINKTVNNWTGALSNSWTLATNWSQGHAPQPTEIAEIGVAAYTGLKLQPTLTANASAYALVFGPNNNPTLTLNSGTTLTITNGMGVNAGSTAIINGPGNINLTGGSFITSTGKLTVALNAVVTLAASSQIVNSGALILASDANGSASIDIVPASSSITGNVTVQRFINGGALKYRGYRLLSSPVFTGLDTHGNKVYSINYLQSSLYLTGTTTTGGFDNIVKANPTLYLLRESLTNPSTASFTSGSYRGINNLTASPSYSIDIDGPGFYIPVGNGYLCFFRGNKASTSFANETKTTYVPQPVTLSTTGTLNVGQVIYKPWFNPTSSNLSFTAASPAINVQGWNFAGNPYASSIDWDQFNTTSSTSGIYGPAVDNTVYIIDPITKNYGYYQAGNMGVGINNVTNIIPSGVGFLVHATSTSAQLIINESAKTSKQATGANLMLGTPVASNPLQYLRLRLVKDSVNTDETMLRINSKGGLDFVQGLDAIYRAGSGNVSLASRSHDQIDIAIKCIVLPKQQGENIYLDVNALVNGIYQITLRDIVAIPRLFDVWLMDNYKKDSLDMRQNLTYSFYIDKRDSTTFGSKRFYISVRQNPAYAYQLVDFTANKLSTGRQVQTNWTTVNEENYTNFTIERSTDNGATFTVLGGITASGAGSYGFVDKTPVIGTNLYRLVQEDINNTITYSKIVPIQYADLSNNLAGHNLGIFPNPASSTINLSIVTDVNTAASLYKIRFMNSSGVKMQEVTTSQPTWQGSVSNLQPGTYIIQVFDNKTQNLIGENKFVKL